MTVARNILPATEARVLIVEDDENLSRVEERFIKSAGHNVRVAGTGHEALALVSTFRPEVVLLDIDLPDLSGLDVCAQIAEVSDAFIIFLTGHGLADERLAGLELGADDYLVKPFRAEAVLNRIAVLLRRRDRMRDWRTNSDRLIGNDGTRMVHSTHTLERNGKSVVLTALEFNLLLFLVDGAGTLLTRGQILEHVWNDTSGIPTRVVDVHIVAIRKKLAEVEAQVEINSVRSVGYRVDVLTSA